MYAQSALVVDRGLTTGARQAALRAAWTGEKDRFVGDDFTVGTAGEVWFIDTFRSWVLVEDAPGPPFQKLTLYGGIAGQPGNPEEAQCACHGIVAIKASGAPGVSLTPAANQPPGGFQEGGKAYRLWEIEFRDVRWSVPGGIAIQFALKAETSRAWFHHASPAQASHRLRVFDPDGQLRSFLGGDENGIDFQVWGHLSAKVAGRRAGAVAMAEFTTRPARWYGSLERQSCSLWTVDSTVVIDSPDDDQSSAS